MAGSAASPFDKPGRPQHMSSVLPIDAFAPPAPRRNVPGYMAMWVGICLEFIEFTLFFVVYFTSRWHHPQEFRDGAHRLWTGGGVAITVAMVTSGWLLTRVVASMRENRRQAAAGWLGLALLAGLVYPMVKFFEWRWNMANGLTAGSGIFVVVYWYLTINHFIHASWGLIGMTWCLGRLTTGGYSAQDHRGLVAMATYWHATDLVWLMLFALFYAFA